MTNIKLFKLTALLVILLLICTRLASQNKIYLSGKIVDHQSNKEIEFANIGIAGKNVGTISNEDGDFELIIPKNLNKDFLVVSYIGYKSHKAKISEIENESIKIKLEAENIEIEEVVVSALTPEQLLKQVLEKIPENYSTKAYMANGFYREIVKENNQPIEIIEAVLEFYKTPYTSDKEADQAKVIKGRNVVSKDPEVFKGLRVSGGPMGGIDYDIVKYQQSFLQTKMFKYYEYKYNNSTKYNGKTVYVIDFDQKEGVKKPLFKGKIYIDIHSLAIVSVNYQYSPKGIKYKRPVFKERMMMKVVGMKVEFKKVKLIVNYEEQGSKWYFKNVFLEALFNFKQAKRKRTALIYFSQSLLITKRNLVNVKSIPKDEQIGRNSKIADETGEYDEKFWKNYNTIKAGNEVKKAAEEIKKANQE